MRKIVGASLAIWLVLGFFPSCANGNSNSQPEEVYGPLQVSLGILSREIDLIQKIRDETTGVDLLPKLDAYLNLAQSELESRTSQNLILWSRGRSYPGIIEDGMDLISGFLAGQDAERIPEFLKPPKSESQARRTARLGVYWSQYFKNVIRPSSLSENEKKAKELASYSVQYLLKINLPVKESLTPEEKLSVITFFAMLRQNGIAADIAPFVTDDSNWRGVRDWEKNLPLFKPYSFLDGEIENIYIGHEVFKFLDHPLRVKMAGDIRKLFPKTGVRFYYGDFNAVARELRSALRAQKAKRDEKTALYGNECDSCHIALNRGDGSTFLDPDDRARMYLKAALFDTFLDISVTKNSKRIVHFNVPTLAESTVPAAELSDLITETFVTLSRLGVCDIIMLRVTSVASGGNSEEPSPAHLEGLRKARELLQG